jgi:hypothetical protein
MTTSTNSNTNWAKLIKRCGYPTINGKAFSVFYCERTRTAYCLDKSNDTIIQKVMNVKKDNRITLQHDYVTNKIVMIVL